MGLVMDEKEFQKRHVLMEVKLMTLVLDKKHARRICYICWLFRVQWQKVQLT
jgi:hypothetical protein